MAKNFDNVQTTRSVKSAFDEAFSEEPEIIEAPEPTPEPTPTPEPETEVAAEPPKEPKKQKDRDIENGVTRVNLALHNDNYMFVKMMAMTKKMTVTGYIDHVFTEMREKMETENPELFKLSQMLFSENK